MRNKLQMAFMFISLKWNMDDRRMNMWSIFTMWIGNSIQNRIDSGSCYSKLEHYVPFFNITLLQFVLSIYFSVVTWIETKIVYSHVPNSQLLSIYYLHKFAIVIFRYLFHFYLLLEKSLTRKMVRNSTRFLNQKVYFHYNPATVKPFFG